jgi:hypothetical protein
MEEIMACPLSLFYSIDKWRDTFEVSSQIKIHSSLPDEGHEKYALGS